MKYYSLRGIYNHIRVALRGRAWIEIMWDNRGIRHVTVALRGRAWIEM